MVLRVQKVPIKDKKNEMFDHDKEDSTLITTLLFNQLDNLRQFFYQRNNQLSK